MNIKMNELVNKTIIEIDDKVSFEDLGNTKIKKLDDVLVKGYVKYTLSEEIEINLQVDGEMILEDSVTLEDVSYPFSFEIAENVRENEAEFEKYFINDKNILDIIEILWENIVLEVPISYTKSQDAKLKGDGWELNGEVQRAESPFAALNELFKGGE